MLETQIYKISFNGENVYIGFNVHLKERQGASSQKKVDPKQVNFFQDETYTPCLI